MKYVPGPAFGQFSGSQGNTTASHNRSGAYIRNRVTPVNPSSQFQQFVRNAFSDLVNAWQNILTQAQRDAWDLYADNVPVKDKLGQDIILTGLNMYVRSNNLRVQYNNIVPGSLTRVDDAPIIFTLAQTDPTASVAIAAGFQPSITFDATLAWVNEDDAVLFLFTGKPVGPSINFFVNPYRIAVSVLGDSVTPPTSPFVSGSLYTYATGQKMFSYCRISRADGRLSPIFRLEPEIVT